VSRLLSIAHGGQVVVSLATQSLIGDSLPESVSLLDRGNHKLRDLQQAEHVFQLCHPKLIADFPALRSLSTNNNLPQQVTSFIGRENELAEVKALLRKTRLLTLIGSGGSGKTRLAIQVAADVLEHFSDGTWLVELASIRDPGLVAQTVAGLFGVKEISGTPILTTLVEHLKDQKQLLILDNCEHVLAACAVLADTILRQCPHVVILASSREGMGILGERTYRVPSLSLPDPKVAQTPQRLMGFESVRLFVERAQFHQSSFEVTQSNAAALASVCHRLDGIPLAIELAAARVRSLSVEEVNQKLDQRFRLLTGGSRTALPRQQTLRSLIDWSYDLLTENEKALLCRLSVFSGGWSLESAERVCSGELVEDEEILDLLTSLVDKSLVVTEEINGATRYRLSETVRQYARDRLLENTPEESLRARHLAHFMTLAEEAEPQLQGTDQKTWLTTLEIEHDNFRAALSFACETSPDTQSGLRLCGALYRFWLVRGYFGEGRTWCWSALGCDQAPTSARAKALNGAGLLANVQGDVVFARSLFEESLTIRRALDDPPGIANSLGNLGLISFEQGDFAASRALFEESLALRRTLKDQWGIGGLLSNLGIVTYYQGDFVASRALFEESLVLRRTLGDRHGIANALGNLGNLAFEQKDLLTARSLHQESLSVSHEIGDQVGIANALECLAGVASAEARPIVSVHLGSAAAALREKLGIPIAPTYQKQSDAWKQAACETLGTASFDAAWADGSALDLDAAIALARHDG
jgi:predicted ATPase/Tfp pilus assembly protein PilF